MNGLNHLFGDVKGDIEKLTKQAAALKQNRLDMIAELKAIDKKAKK